MQTKTDDPKKDCVDIHDDYFECLHHSKEFARNNKIVAQIKKYGVPEKPEPVAASESPSSG